MTANQGIIGVDVGGHKIQQPVLLRFVFGFSGFISTAVEFADSIAVFRTTVIAIKGIVF